MLKQDLKDGMILETRNGERFLPTNSVMRSFDGYASLSWFNDDLTYSPNNQYDIVKVYKETTTYSLTDIFKDENLTLIWERKETKLTDREVEVLKALKTLTYKYIARDEDGELYAYQNKPEKQKHTKEWLNDYRYYLIEKDIKLFNFIKWVDDEPTKIGNLLKEKEL